MCEPCAEIDSDEWLICCRSFALGTAGHRGLVMVRRCVCSRAAVSGGAVELPATQEQRAACGPANQMQAEIRGKSFVNLT